VCLGENEGTLDNRLHIYGEALGAPLSIAAVGAQRCGDVQFQHGDVFAEGSLAGLADCRMRLVGLLHHGAQETGEFGQRPLQERLAKLHIAQEAIDRVNELPIGCGGKQTVRQRRKMPGRRYRQIFLGREVMEECALGHPGALADVIHRGCRVTPGADDIHGRVQQFGFRTGLRFPGWHANVTIPTGRYGVKNSRAPKKKAPHEAGLQINFSFEGFRRRCTSD